MAEKAEKKAKKKIKVQDLKPRKDAKGGVSVDVRTNHPTGPRGSVSRGQQGGKHTDLFI